MKNNEKSGAELKQQRAEDEAARVRAMGLVDWNLRELTANLMRIVRGAGEPARVRQQADALIASMVAFRDVVGHFAPMKSAPPWRRIVIQTGWPA
jgi:hypothetical protein